MLLNPFEKNCQDLSIIVEKLKKIGLVLSIQM